MKKQQIGLIILVIVAIVAMYFYLKPVEYIASVEKTPVLQPDTPKVVKQEEEKPPEARYPIPVPELAATTDLSKEQVEADAPTRSANPKVAELPALPTLEDSDGLFVNTLNNLFESYSVKELFRKSNLIPRIVVTVDNLLHQRITPSQFPTTQVAGKIIVEVKEGQQVLSKNNYARYDVYVSMLESVNKAALIKAYIHMYPLFQQSYIDLGEPNAYFNDRLVDVIDDLMQAPEIDKKIKLSRTSVMYKFDDPQLESLSVGQKIMIRMGPKNSKRVKKELVSIRELLVASHLPKIIIN